MPRTRHAAGAQAVGRLVRISGHPADEQSLLDHFDHEAGSGHLQGIHRCRVADRPAEVGIGVGVPVPRSSAVHDVVELLEGDREFGQSKPAGRHDPRGLPCGALDEPTRARVSFRRHPEPERRPEDVRDRKHGLGGDIAVGGREDEVGPTGGLQHESRAGGAAEPEHIPGSRLFEGVTVLLADDEHLIAGCAVRCASRGREDRVGVGTVGDHRSLLPEVERTALDLDRAGAAAHIASDADLGRGRGEKKPVFCHPAAKGADGVGVPVSNEAGDLDGMHRQDHPRRRAPTSDLGDRVGHVIEAGTQAALVDSDHRPEQPGVAHGIDRLVRKAAGRVDVARIRAGDLLADGSSSHSKIDHQIDVFASHRHHLTHPSRS